MENKLLHYHWNQEIKDVETIVLASLNYKIDNNYHNRLRSEADKLFGVGNWKEVNYTGSDVYNLRYWLGWYAVDAEGECLAIEAI